MKMLELVVYKDIFFCRLSRRRGGDFVNVPTRGINYTTHIPRHVQCGFLLIVRIFREVSEPSDSRRESARKNLHL